MRDQVIVEQEQAKADQKQMFDSEIRTLKLILLIFSTSYLVRALWNAILIESSKNFGQLMIQTVLGLSNDCMPILFVLFYHLRNFKEAKLD